MGNYNIEVLLMFIRYVNGPTKLFPSMSTLDTLAKLFFPCMLNN